MLKSTEKHVFVWGVQSRTGEMVSVPDILWKSRVPPWFIRTVSGEEHWRSNLCIGRYYLASALGFDVCANQFRSVAGSIQSGKFRFWFLWRQVQAGRATSGKERSTFLSLICIFPLFYGWGAHLPKHWSTFNRRTDSSVKSQLEADWKDTRTVSELNFHRSSSQLRPDFSTCTTTNYHHICVCARELHSFTPTVNTQLWPEHSVCCT